MIKIAKKKNKFSDFQKYLIRRNKNYDFFRNELFFNLIYKKKNFLIAFISLIRDFFVFIGYPEPQKTNKIFFFTLPNQSGFKIFKNLPFFNKKNLVKAPLNRNKGIKSESLKFFPSIKFFKFFYTVVNLIGWKKNDGIIIFFYVLRLSLIVSIWRFYLLKNNQKKVYIYLHNDFDIYNAALIFLVKQNLIDNLQIDIFCLQHGIPTDEFFPTKSPQYFLWSKKMYDLFKIKDLKFKKSKFKIFRFKELLLYKSKKKKKYFLDPKLYFVSQGHTKIYGNKANLSLIKFYNKLSKEYANTHCLLHPSENKKDNIYLSKHSNHIHEFPHDFSFKNKIKVYLCFCSTAMIEIMKNNHIVIGIDIKVDQSKKTYDYFKPPLTIKKPYQIIDILNKINYDNSYFHELIENQNKYLRSIFNSN